MIFRASLLYFLITLAGCESATKKETPKLNDEEAIKMVLATQVIAWNNADIEGFMEGYWKSDSLLFVGSKITSGWDSTLVRYKKSYPDKAAMGTLRFEIIRMLFISNDSYLVTGKYFLAREKDNPSGIFTLLFKKKNGKWVVAYDHTA